MKGVMSAIAAVGVLLLGGLRFCGRIGDDVLSVAKRADVPHGSRYMDDLSPGVRNYGHLENADDLLRRYPGAINTSPKTMDALEFLDVAGQVYEEFTPEETAEFWYHADAITKLRVVDNKMALSIYQHLVANKNEKLLQTEFAHFARADSLLPYVLELDTHHVLAVSDNYILVKLAIEFQLQKELRQTGFRQYQMSPDEIIAVWSEYLALCQEISQLPNGRDVIIELNAIFLNQTPFLPLTAGLQRVEEVLDGMGINYKNIGSQ